MSAKSGIEWTDATWNPVTGCSKVSQGCKHCYAERQWPRLSAMPNTIYSGRDFTDVRCHGDRLEQPLRWKKPRKIFVNSMSDLFHPDVSFEFIADVFAVMWCTTRHTYQILTKRPARMLEFFKWLDEETDSFGHPSRVKPTKVWPQWTPARDGHGGYDNCGPLWPPENVWLGVSIEDQATADERIPLLLQTPAAVRWVSAEPLLGPVDLSHLNDGKETNEVNALKAWTWEEEIEAWRGTSEEWEEDFLNWYNLGEMPSGPAHPKLDWIVAGGESGPNARPTEPAWARSLRDQCAAAGVAFNFKQWGEWAPAEEFASEVQEHYDVLDQTTDTMIRVGKKRAGRLLDGVLHDGYPEVKA